MLDEQRNVLAPLAQRRQRGAGTRAGGSRGPARKRALLDFLLEDAVRGADDAHVDLLRRRRADGANLALLQDAQQLGLQGERHLADLVEEQRAAVGDLEEALLVVVGAGERALLVAEQLALEQVLRHRRAVLRHEQLVAPARPGSGRRGDQLLAGAGLALDEHGDARVDDLLELLEDLAHRRRLADDVGEAPLLLAALQVLHFAAQLLLGEAQPLHQARVLDRQRRHVGHRGDEIEIAAEEHAALAADLDDAADGLAVPQAARR